MRDKPNWKRTEDVLLSYNQEEEPVRLVEDFSDLPGLKPSDLFSFLFYSWYGIEDHHRNYDVAWLKNNYNFYVSDKIINQVIGLILIRAYHTLPGEKNCLLTKPSMSAPAFSWVMRHNRFQKIKQYFLLAVMAT